MSLVKLYLNYLLLKTINIRLSKNFQIGTVYKIDNILAFRIYGLTCVL